MKGLLRFIAAGNVDDGKSTLIGRLLHDSDVLRDDQMQAIKKASESRGDTTLNLAFVTDGLRAEREQGITIDVAYRYFATPERKFIVADVPGHFEFTRNMVTAATTANLAVILVDAAHGLTEQTRRHTFLASLLKITHLAVCINKMDLFSYSEEVFARIRDEFTAFSKDLGFKDITLIPVSALVGDNIVSRSTKMPWFTGKPFLEHLETVDVSDAMNTSDFRFPVQMPLKSESGAVYAGSVASGCVRVGDELRVLPRDEKCRVKEIDVAGKKLTEATAGMAVTLKFDATIDLVRGELLTGTGASPKISREIDAMVCWLNDQRSLRVGDTAVLQNSTRRLKCEVRKIHYKVDVNSMRQLAGADMLGLNEIARVTLVAESPLAFDVYASNRMTGSLVLVDAETFRTSGAGMIL